MYESELKKITDAFGARGRRDSERNSAGEKTMETSLQVQSVS